MIGPLVVGRLFPGSGLCQRCIVPALLLNRTLRIIGHILTSGAGCVRYFGDLVFAVFIHNITIYALQNSSCTINSRSFHTCLPKCLQPAESLRSK